MIYYFSNNEKPKKQKNTFSYCHHESNSHLSIFQFFFFYQTVHIKVFLIVDGKMMWRTGAKEYKAKLYLVDSIYTKGYLLFAVMVPILTIGTLVYLTFHVLRIGIHYLFQKRKRQSVSARRSAMPCFFAKRCSLKIPGASHSVAEQVFRFQNISISKFPQFHSCGPFYVG